MDGGLGTLTHPSARACGALRADHARYLAIARRTHGGWRAQAEVLLELGFLAIAVYRFGRWSRTVTPRLLGLPFKVAYRVMELAVRIVTGIEISADSCIGPGFYIGHSGGIVINGTLGANCSIAQGVTIGAKGAGRSNGYPTLGDRVYLGAGAMVIGAVQVGDDVTCGANTVIVHDIPAGARVVSAPVRILPRHFHGGTSA